MRLEGRSDVTYRAYDLLTKERMTSSIVTYLRAAGQYVPQGYTHNALGILQNRFIQWGFPVLTYGDIESLLHEFWVYNRIVYGGKTGWPLRDPDESRKLAEQNEEALKVRSTAN